MLIVFLTFHQYFWKLNNACKLEQKIERKKGVLRLMELMKQTTMPYGYALMHTFLFHKKSLASCLVYLYQFIDKTIEE